MTNFDELDNIDAILQACESEPMSGEPWNSKKH